MSQPSVEHVVVRGSSFGAAGLFGQVRPRAVCSRPRVADHSEGIRSLELPRRSGRVYTALHLVSEHVKAACRSVAQIAAFEQRVAESRAAGARRVDEHGIGAVKERELALSLGCAAAHHVQVRREEKQPVCLGHHLPPSLLILRSSP